MNGRESFKSEYWPKSSSIEWVAVRPDSLIVDLAEVTEYELHPSPQKPILMRVKPAGLMLGIYSDFNSPKRYMASMERTNASNL
ncbi:MAG: hypothetical protein R3B93_28760 [Bacteroidia bacterium]